VGERFQADVVIRERPRRTRVRRNKNGDLVGSRSELDKSQTWTVSGSYWIGVVLSPGGQLADRPPNTVVASSFSTTETVTCESLFDGPERFRPSNLSCHGRSEHWQKYTPIKADGSTGEPRSYKRHDRLCADSKVLCLEGEEVDVLEIGGRFYPVEQFASFPPEAAGVTITTGGSSSTTQSFDGEPEIACSEDHYYRPDFRPIVQSVEATPFSLTLPKPQPCGFGKVSEIPASTITVPKEHAEAYRAVRT